MLFLHPAFGDCRVWDTQWQTFAPTFSLVRCDLPGFGRTPIEQPTVTLAGEVASLLDELELGACAVVGNSLGGRVALELAVGRPELVRGADDLTEEQLVLRCTSGSTTSASRRW